MVSYIKVLDTAELKLLCTNPSEVEEMLIPDDVDDPFENQTCLEKEWHILHYALCKSIEPDGSALADSILGGNPMGPDLGYGHGRLIHSGRVKEISEALNASDFDKLYSEIKEDDSKLKELYGSFEFDEGEKKFLFELFEKLKATYTGAAEENRAVFAYLA